MRKRGFISVLQLKSVEVYIPELDRWLSWDDRPREYRRQQVHREGSYMSVRSSAAPQTMQASVGALGASFASSSAGVPSRLSTTSALALPSPALAAVPSVGNAAAGGSSSPAGSSSPVQSPEHRARSGTPTETLNGAPAPAALQLLGSSGTATLMTSSTASTAAASSAPSVPASNPNLNLHVNVNELSFSNLPLVGCPPMLVRRSRCALCAAGGRLYAAGGFNGESNLCSVEMFDPIAFYRSLLEQSQSNAATATSAQGMPSVGPAASSSIAEPPSATSSQSSNASSAAGGAGNRNSPLAGAPSPGTASLNGWQFVAQLVAHEGGVALGVLPLLLD